MRKKMIILGIVFLLFLGSILIAFHKNRMDDSELIESIFGISKSQYEVSDVKNTLNWYKYGGSYAVTLEVSEEQMNTFISELESEFVIMEEPEGRELYSIILKNLIGVEPCETDIIYGRMWGFKRKPFIEIETVIRVIRMITKTPDHRTTESAVIYASPVDGVYEVQMVYLE